MEDRKSFRLTGNIGKFGGGHIERTNELLATHRGITKAKIADMKEQTRERTIMIGTGVGLVSGGLIGGSIGGGAGAFIGGIVGSVVPGPGTVVGIVVGSAIGAAIGGAGAGGAGTAIGYAKTNKDCKKAKKNGIKQK